MAPPIYDIEDLLQAKYWLIDCFPEQLAEIVRATPAQVWANVAKFYDGGIAGFMLAR